MALQFPFQGLRTFLKATTSVTRNTRLAVMGMPWDGATSYRPGARLGPAGIREASMALTDGDHPVFSGPSMDAIADLGDMQLVSTDPATVLGAVEAATDAVLAQDLHPAFLGGDHTLTLGVLRAYRRRLGRPMATIIFDAHCDTWETHWGAPYGHGTWVRRAIEEGVVDPKRCVQIGIRSPCDPVTAGWLPKKGGLVLNGRELDLHRAGAAETRKRVEGIIGDAPCYLSFDIDALDPAHAPGTGTPEIGGLTTHFALQVLEGMVRTKWVGMDVVEVSPPWDTNAGITSLAGATLVWSYLSMVAKHVIKK